MTDVPAPLAVPGDLARRLRAGEVVLGPLIFDLLSPGLAVVLAEAGWDFVLIDLEHAPLDASSVAQFTLSARQAGLATIVKLPDLERSGVQRYLDYGAAGIQAPHVETTDEVRKLVSWSRYPPVGERGQVFGLGNTGFRLVDRDRYVAEANASVLTLAMIETRAGVEAVEAILDGGPDVVFVGTGDLSSSYGVPGQMTHPTVLEAAERVLAACRARGVAVAINAEEPETAQRWIERGAQMIAYSSELGMIRRQSQALLEPLVRTLRASGRRSATSLSS
ncbi:MAG: siderophore biosynthesis protein SbnG [Chloroflexi bacterium]|nr:siderophore biosynthesis protein SbnG [Chloroflexota bacterium]